MVILIGKLKSKRKINKFNNIIMKQKNYCRPETEFLAVVPENILCVSKIEGNENEGFGTDGKLPEMDW